MAYSFLYYFLCTFFVTSMASHGIEDTTFAKKDSLNVSHDFLDESLAESASVGEIDERIIDS